jgi:hypothetical protein
LKFGRVKQLPSCAISRYVTSTMRGKTGEAATKASRLWGSRPNDSLCMRDTKYVLSLLLYLPMHEGFSLPLTLKDALLSTLHLPPPLKPSSLLHSSSHPCIATLCSFPRISSIQPHSAYARKVPHPKHSWITVVGRPVAPLSLLHRFATLSTAAFRLVLEPAVCSQHLYSNRL